jgi:hypothetical protein
MALFKNIPETKKLTFLITIIFSLYSLFPTSNSTIDAYYYAACIKYDRELFLPHHLLYNWLGYIIYRPIVMAGILVQPLAMMKIINALYASGCLLIFYSILKKLNYNVHMILPLVAISGLTFGMWRFATENENYIIPIFFSLFASYYFLLYNNEKKSIHLVISGTAGAIACLFHQIHFFWWLALLIGIVLIYKKLKPFLLFGLPAFIVPFVYLIVMKFYYHLSINIFNIMHFVFQDFYNGQVDTSIGTKNFSLTAISFIRTFFQIHGLQIILIKRNFLYALPVIFVLTLFVWILFKRKNLSLSAKNKTNKPFILIHLGVFILQLLFAFYSVGNAEFMVMLPFPFLIVLTYYMEIKTIALWLFVAVLLVWNLMLGILPNFIYNYWGTEYVISKVIHNNSAFYILNDKPLIENILYYKYGNEATRNITNAPNEYIASKRPLVKLSDTINYLLERDEKVFTNCIDKPKIMNRAAFIVSISDNEFFKNYKTEKTDSFDTFFGKYYFTILRKDTLK